MLLLDMILPELDNIPPITVDGLEDERISNNFRFDSKEQLRRLFNGFQFPKEFITSSRHKLTGEEVFLFGLFRLHSSPAAMTEESVRTLFGYKNPCRGSMAFRDFLKFMVSLLNSWF